MPVEYFWQHAERLEVPQLPPGGRFAGVPPRCMITLQSDEPYRVFRYICNAVYARQ